MYVQEGDTTAQNKSRSGLTAILKKKAPSREPGNIIDNTQKEIDRYLAFPNCNMEADILVWWKVNVANFPTISQLARKYLPIQGTTVPTERVFSTGGHIVTDLRCSLTTKHVEQLVFLSMNKCIIPRN